MICYKSHLMILLFMQNRVFKLSTNVATVIVEVIVVAFVIVFETIGVKRT